MSHRRPRIGIKVSQYLGTQAHGAESHTILSFVEILEKDFDVTIFGSEVTPNKLSKYRVEVGFRYYFLYSFLRKFFHIPMSIFQCWIFVLKNKPDLLFSAGGLWYNGLSVTIIGKIFGIPTLVRTAEDHFRYYQFCKTMLARLQNRFFNNWLSYFVLRNCENFMTVGKNSLDYFRSYGVPIDRSWFVPGLIRRDRFRGLSATKQSIRLKHGYHVEDKIFLYVGAVSGVKGADMLPEIVEAVCKERNDCIFVIVGQEIWGEGILNGLRQMGGDRVQIKPPVSHDELKELFYVADCLIFLTRVGVGYGNVNLEATLCGCPVVGFNSGLDVEWLLGNQCYSNPQDIANALLEDNFQVLNLPPEFEDDYICEKTLKIFWSVVESRGRWRTR